MNSDWQHPDSPDSAPYPNIWFEFTAKESKNSDRIVKYWIQDIPAERFDDAIQHLKEHFILDAPVSKFFGAATKENYVEDYLRPVRLALRGKACLVCFRERSDEIVGLNIAYRATRNDTQMPEVYKAVQTDEYREHMKISSIMYEGIDLFEKYNLDQYLNCLCLSVSRNFRGLKIGQRLIEAMEPLCKSFNIPIVASRLSSDYANNISDSIGFQIEKQCTMNELYNIYPKIPFQQIDAKMFTVKTWNFQKKNQRSYQPMNFQQPK